MITSARSEDFTNDPDLSAELATAVGRARSQLIAPFADSMNFRLDVAPWGFDFVSIWDGRYRPDLQGDAALIVAAEAGGELADLIACRLKDRAMASRRGAAAILGEDAVQVALITSGPLYLFHDAIQWANGGFRGATVVDWRAAREALLEVPSITCASRELASRVHQVLSAPPKLPVLAYAARRN